MADVFNFRSGGAITFQWAPEPMLVAKGFDAAAAYLENMLPPLIASRQIAQVDMAEHFAEQHGPNGEKWKAWSKSYVKSGPPGPPYAILGLTGDLSDSAVSASAWPITAREMFFDFGALPEYGLWHQTGVSRASAGKGVTRQDNVKTTSAFEQMGITTPSGGMYGANDLPARPFAGIGVEAQFQIVEVFEQWFDNAGGIAIGSSGVAQRRTALGRFGPKITLGSD